MLPGAGHTRGSVDEDMFADIVKIILIINTKNSRIMGMLLSLARRRELANSLTEIL
jgi:hypothetical protein